MNHYETLATVRALNDIIERHPDELERMLAKLCHRDRRPAKPWASDVCDLWIQDFGTMMLSVKVMGNWCCFALDAYTMMHSAGGEYTVGLVLPVADHKESRFVSFLVDRGWRNVGAAAGSTGRHRYLPPAERVCRTCPNNLRCNSATL